MRDRSKKVV